MTDTTTPADEQCYEVPLIERLRRVPRDARFWVEAPMESTHYPVGHLCHLAADALEKACAASQPALQRITEADEDDVADSQQAQDDPDRMTPSEKAAAQARLRALIDRLDDKPAQEPVFTTQGPNDSPEHLAVIRKILAKEPAQEPVAYLEPATGFMRLVKDTPPSDMEMPAFKLLFKTGMRVWLYAAPPAMPAQEPVAMAFEDCAVSESFEDGVSAGLHERGITSLSAAWMAGRMDFIEEVRLAAACTTYAAPPADAARQDRIMALADEYSKQTLLQTIGKEHPTALLKARAALEREVRKPT